MQARIVDPMGFAVNPAIANRPIALEVDRARLGQMRRLLLAILVLVAAACFDGWQRGQFRSLGFDSSSAQRQRAAEEARTREYRLEFESRLDPVQIAMLARQLGFVPATLGDVIVIQRVERHGQPPSSVVASR